MDKMTFESYKFKPSDVIEGLNRYFAEAKANRYRRVPLEIQNGEVKPGNYYVIRNIVFDVNVPKIKEVGYYYVICDPEEVAGVAINWLREEHDIFYTPGMDVPGKTILTPEMKALVANCNADEVFKTYKKRTLSDRIEELQESRRDLIETLQRRLHEAKRRIVALEAGHAEKSKIIDRQAARIKELEKQIAEEAEENRILRGDLDYFADLAQKRQTALSNLRYEILKVYREIFDCSDGDPEGTDAEILQDILSEYKRTLELKDAAEEKTIKYKELARENEDKLTKEKEWTKRLEQKLIAIQDICER